ncbi:hypothetical protein L3X38_003713 [Prunus dulcis]|uniref:Uncharacterized protein n=1 Tax=Prunus dulcis TaxID=3755 RepID=A0AAD5F2B9_PRUDU|nr:hypothetical protein L3X38_003713 [Prunus dulcis]
MIDRPKVRGIKLLSAKKRSIVPSLEHEIALFRKAINRPSTAIDHLTRLNPAKMFLILVPRIQTIQNDEMKTPSNSTMTTNQSLENILENRGKPPNRYSPDIGKTSKYPIANHVSTEKLYELLKAFVHQLSAIHIPTKVGKALKDPK